MLKYQVVKYGKVVAEYDNSNEARKHLYRIFGECINVIAG